MPEAQLLNRGIGGQGTVQNLLQFRRDIANGHVDAAVFAIFSDHRFRNIAQPRRMRQFMNMEWYGLGVEHVPFLRQGRGGENTIVYVPLCQPALKQGGFDDFLPDDHMIDTATLTILAEIQDLAQTHSIPVQFALLDQNDPGFNDIVQKRFTSTLDISVPLDTVHSFLPLDRHPNQTANRIFADRLLPAVKNLVAQTRSGPAQCRPHGTAWGATLAAHVKYDA